MLKLALTGGMGTGKSTVAVMLEQLGAVVIDADQAVREVQRPGSAGLARLVAAFGSSILTPQEELNRPRLAEIVFANPAARTRLEGIIHPLVREWMEQHHQAALSQGAEVVVHDIPLLFEGRGSKGFDAVLLVYAPEQVALCRLTEQRGFSESEARARMNAQLSIEKKRQLADYVIENTDSLEELEREVGRVWRELIKG
ncbi:MAG: dephospho-CoA kinase [Candidatus Dormibacteraceae bacterium]